MDGTIRVRTAAWFATAVVLSVFATLLVMQEWRADAAPGSEDATWVPIEPCRLFDYRPGEPPSGGKKSPLVAGSAATQQVTGTVGNCVLPTSGVVGVSLNVTAVNGTAQSNLRLYPADGAVPLVSNMNWSAGDSPVANKVDVKLSSAGEVKLLNHNGTVDVVGDVVGYYTDSTLKEITASLAGMPFSESAFENESSTLTATVAPQVSLSVTAPVAGHVTLNSTSQAISIAPANNDILCVIADAAHIPATLTESTEGVQWFENRVAPEYSSLAGTHRFFIPAGATIEYTLACNTSAPGKGSLQARNLTAIFTPAP